MRLIATAAMVTLGVSLCSPALAASYWIDGNVMYTKCSSSSAVDQNLCRGFVMGTLDSATMLQHPITTRICVPDGVQASQIADVFTLWLKNHPANRHFAAVGLVFDAVGEAFPC